jgi:hypothetical protein
MRSNGFETGCAVLCSTRRRLTGRHDGRINRRLTGDA